jgi:hypothetical protein
MEQTTSFSDSVEMTLSGDAISKPGRKNENMLAYRWPVACRLEEEGRFASIS